MYVSAPAYAAPSGPTIRATAPTLVDGTVHISIIAEGSGFPAYDGFNLHLRWSPGVFTFGDINAAGGLFDPASGAFCIANRDKYDADGGGVTFACTGLGSSSATTATGLLATLTLRPSQSGCSKVHFFTFGSPDGGDSTSGTYTIDDDTSTAQANPYIDLGVDVDGQLCQSGELEPPPTPSATSTTPVPGATPSLQAEPATSGTIGPRSVPAASGAPRPGGAIRPPSTGGGIDPVAPERAGQGSVRWDTGWVVVTLMIGALLFVFCARAVYAYKRKNSSAFTRR